MSQATRSTESPERDALELDRETLQDLSSGEAEQAVGGMQRIEPLQLNRETVQQLAGAVVAQPGWGPVYAATYAPTCTCPQVGSQGTPCQVKP